MNKLLFSWPQKKTGSPRNLRLCGAGYLGIQLPFYSHCAALGKPDRCSFHAFPGLLGYHDRVDLEREKSFSLKGKNFRPLLALALLEPPYYFFESYGVYYSNATFAGTVMAFAPVVGILAAMLFLGEKPTRRQKIFSLLPTAGVIIITSVGSSMGIVKPLGAIFLFASQIVAAGMKLYNKKSSEEFSSFERTYAIVVANAIIFTIKSMIDLHGDVRAYAAPLGNPEYVFALVVLCLFCSIAANLLVNYACGMMSVTRISTFSTIATICSAFGGVIFLGEPITWMTFFWLNDHHHWHMAGNEGCLMSSLPTI